MTSPEPSVPEDTILVVDDEVIVRNAIAEYLRHCGYRVIEAASADEAKTVLRTEDIRVDITLSAIALKGDMDGFSLMRWSRDNRPDVEFILAGTSARAASEAADLCEEGPHLRRPYEPQTVLDRIRRLLAGRTSRPIDE